MSENGDMTSEMLTQGSALKSAPPAARSSRLCEAEIKALAAGMVRYLREAFAPEMMEKFVEPLLRTRERRLEERIRAIEQRRLLEDAGLWNRASEYFIGQCVTFDGSAWVCLRDNTSGSGEQPGKSDAWRLWVQRGRNGRDAPR